MNNSKAFKSVILSIVFIGACVFWNEAGAIGGASTGGGSGYRQGLLDLVLYNPVAFRDATVGEKLPRTKAFLVWGFDRLNSSNSVVTRQAIEQVSLWSESSPLLTTELQRALVDMPLYYTQGRISWRPKQYWIPSSVTIRLSEIYSVGLVIKGFGNFTSTESFEEFSRANQIAYLIHEAGRYLQIQGRLHINDETLQNLTAKLMNVPSKNESVDTDEFLKGPLLQLKQSRQAVLTLAQDICASTSTYCAHDQSFVRNLMMGQDIPAVQRLARDFGKASSRIFAELLNQSIATDEKTRIAKTELMGKFDRAETMLDIVALKMMGEKNESAIFEMGRLTRHYWVLDKMLAEANTSSELSEATQTGLNKVKAALLDAGLASAQ